MSSKACICGLIDQKMPSIASDLRPRPVQLAEVHIGAAGERDAAEREPLVSERDELRRGRLLWRCGLCALLSYEHARHCSIGERVAKPLKLEQRVEARGRRRAQEPRPSDSTRQWRVVTRSGQVGSAR